MITKLERLAEEYHNSRIRVIELSNEMDDMHARREMLAKLIDAAEAKSRRAMAALLNETKNSGGGK